MFYYARPAVPQFSSQWILKKCKWVKRVLLQSRNLTVPEKVILRGHTTSAAPFLQVTSAFIQQGLLVLLQLCTPAVDVTLFIMQIRQLASSQTQGQIKGARESLNGRKNIYGTNKMKERQEEPLGTTSYQTSSKLSPLFWLLIGARKTQVFWHQSEAGTAATVWNWSGKTLSLGALLADLYFSSRHIYPPV